MASYSLDPKQFGKKYILPTKTSSISDLQESANQSAEDLALATDIHGNKYQIGIDEHAIDGDTTSGGRFIGYDTFESTPNSKTDKLSKLGLPVPQQTALGLEGKNTFQDYLGANAGKVIGKVGTDVYGRALLDDSTLAEHMVGKGVAVPTDRYDTKLQNLYRTTQEKIQKLDPARGKAMEIQREYNIDRQKPGFFTRALDAIDAFQSGTQQALLGTVDAGLDLVTPGDNTLLNNLKSKEVADAAWGYNSNEADFAKQEALHKFKNQEYVGAITEMVKSPELWGESLPMIAEMGFGVGKFTALGKVLKLSTAGLQGAEKAAKIKEIKDKATALEKVAHLGASNVGFMGTVADQSNRHIEEFTENNNGVPPTFEQSAGIIALDTLQLGLDRMAFGQLINTKGGINSLKETVAPLLQAVPEGRLYDVAKGVVKSSTAVTAAMGTEAGQEYLQSWAELLNTRAGTAKYGDWMNVLQSESAQDEAVIGALAGAGMGIQMKGGSEVIGGIGSALSNRQPRTEVTTAPENEQVSTSATQSAAKPQPSKTVRPVTEVLADLATSTAQMNADEAAHIAAGTMTEELKADFARERKIAKAQKTLWEDVGQGIADEEIANQWKVERNTTQDKERKAYLNDVLKKIESRTAKQDLTSIIKGNQAEEQRYREAVNLVRTGSKASGKTSNPVSILDTLKATYELDDMRAQYNAKEPASNHRELQTELESTIAKVVTNKLTQISSDGAIDLSSEEVQVGAVKEAVREWLTDAGVEANPDVYGEVVVRALAHSAAYGDTGTSEGPKTTRRFGPMPADLEGFTNDEGQAPSDTQAKGNSRFGAMPTDMEGFTQPEETGNTEPASGGGRFKQSYKQKAQEEVKQKMDAPAAPEFDMENVETPTHTGISKRTILVLARDYGIPAARVKSAMDIAFENMLVRKMKSVSKEANKVQYEMYYGKDGAKKGGEGIVSLYAEYKTALENKDLPAAQRAIAKLQQRYINQRYKELIAADSIKDTLEKITDLGDKATLEDVKAAVGDIKITVQGAEGSDSSYTLTGMDVAKLHRGLSTDVGDQITFTAGGVVLQAISESTAHLEGMFAREGFTLPKVGFRKSNRGDLARGVVKTIKDLEADLTRLESAEKDVTEDMTNEELLAISQLQADVQKVKNTYEKRKADLKKLLVDMRTNPYQYVKQIDGVDASKAEQSIPDLDGKLGQTAGTMTAAEAKAAGLELAPEQIEEFTPALSDEALRNILKRLEDLKKERQEVGKELVAAEKAKADRDTKHKVLTAQLVQIANGLGDNVKNAVRSAWTAATDADKVVADKMLSIKKMKVKTKELEAVQKFLDTNDKIFKDAKINLDQFASVYKSYNKWLDSAIKGGSIPKIAERNAQLQKLIKAEEGLEGTVNSLLGIAKQGIVVLRRLMGLKPEQFTDMTPAELKTTIAARIEGLKKATANAQEALAQAKSNRTVAFKEAMRQIVTESEKAGIAKAEQMTRTDIKEVIFEASRKAVLTKNVRKAKKLTKERVQKINKEIAALTNKIKGDRWVGSLVDKNMSVFMKLKTAGVEYITQEKKQGPDPLLEQFKNLEIKGSVLAQLDFDALKTLVPGQADLVSHFNRVAEYAKKGIAEVLPNFADDSTKMMSMLAENPGMMALANIVKNESNGQYNIKYDENVLNALMLTAEGYLLVNNSKLNYNDNLAVANIIGAQSEHAEEVRAAAPALRHKGLLLTTVATRIGEDFARAMGIKQGTMGSEQWAKFTADLGNRALQILKANGLVEITTMEQEVWNRIAPDKKLTGKKEVVFVHTTDRNDKQKETDQKRLKEFNAIDDVLGVFDQQSQYRTYPVYAEFNGTVYKIDKSPFAIPEASQEVLRKQHDQVYVVQTTALTKFVGLASTDAGRKQVLERLGWKDVEEMKEKEELFSDIDAQLGKNRELEEVLSKLVEMHNDLSHEVITPEVFFNWFFTINGRFMIDAVGINPQADKHASRWFLVPKESSDVSWNTKDKDDMRAIHDRIAQAFGMDIDAETDAEVETFAKEMIEKYNTDAAGFTKGVNDGSIKAPHYGHALQAIEFMEAMKGKTSFVGTLTAEYDAKTSGLAHKNMQAPMMDENGTFGSTTEEYLGKAAIKVGEVGFDEGASAHVKGIIDIYKTSATNGIKRMAEVKADKDYEPDPLFEVLDSALPRMYKTEIVDDKEVPVLDEENNIVITSDARKLSKEAVIPFGYAASTTSMKKSIGYKLAYQVLREVINPKNTELRKNLSKELAITEARMEAIVGELKSKYAEDVKLNEKDSMGKKGLLDTIAEKFTNTYGEAFSSSLEDTFKEQVKMNELIKTTTKAMFRMWKIKYDQELAKIPNPTVEQKAQLVRDLEAYFPLIKAPWSESREDGIAIFNTKRSGLDNEVLPSVRTAIKENGKLTSAAVQAMILEMEETFAAGAVLPIHWIDATQIGTVMKDGGITGVHDAIVIGKNGKDTVATVKKMNKAMYDIHANYNMMEEFQLAFMRMLETADETLIETFVNKEASRKEDEAINLATLKQDIDTMVKQINTAREAMYNQNVTVGNIVAYKGTEYSSKEDQVHYNKLDETLDSILKGC